MASMAVAPAAKKDLTGAHRIAWPSQEKKEKKKTWPKLSIGFSSELTVLLIGYLEQIYNAIL